MLYINNPYTDAWFNLAAEEYLLKNFSDDIFMLWQNEPSVIIGKHQNVWDEINRNYIQEKHIKVVRRYSGGGAVYHDSGNLNITFIQNSKELASGTFTARLIAFLATFGIRAEADERQALTIDGLKISGSAQSIHKGRILHHATLLFSTDLYRLTTALKNTERKPEKKEMKPAPFYVKSVRSPVTNICTYTRKAVSIGEFRDALLNYFTKNKTDTRPYSFTEDDLNAIRSLRDNKYATSAWNFNIRT